MDKGIRNNNPGNLEYDPYITWDGQLPKDQQTDLPYLKFDTMTDGVRALAMTLVNYQKIHGLDTIAAMINRFAPPATNNTAAYISDVSSRMGVASGATINMMDPQTARMMVAAITAHENGNYMLDPGVVQNGVNEALQALA